MWVTMVSVKVSLRQFQDRLPELLDQVVNTEEEYVVQRNGKNYAVLVSARQWRRRTIAERLGRLGPEYRLPRQKQARAEALLAKSKRRTLSPAERPTSRDIKSLDSGLQILRRRRSSGEP